jgi:hypothetical protein
MGNELNSKTLAETTMRGENSPPVDVNVYMTLGGCQELSSRVRPGRKREGEGRRMGQDRERRAKIK